MIRELSAGIVFVRLAHFSKSCMIVLSGTKNKHQTIIKDDMDFQHHTYSYPQQQEFVIFRRSLVPPFAATAVS